MHILDWKVVYLDTNMACHTLFVWGLAVLWSGCLWTVLILHLLLAFTAGIVVYISLYLLIIQFNLSSLNFFIYWRQYPMRWNLLSLWFLSIWTEEFDDLCTRSSKLAEESHGAPMFTVAEKAGPVKQTDTTDSDLQEPISKDPSSEDDWQILWFDHVGYLAHVYMHWCRSWTLLASMILFCCQ